MSPVIPEATSESLLPGVTKCKPVPSYLEKLSFYFSSKHCYAFCLITQSSWMKGIFLWLNLSLSLTLPNKHTEFLKRFFNFLITASVFMFPNFKFKRLPKLGIVLWCWFMRLMQKRTVLTNARIYLARQAWFIKRQSGDTHIKAAFMWQV